MNSYHEYEITCKRRREAESRFATMFAIAVGHRLTDTQRKLLSDALEAWEDYIDRKHGNEWHGRDE
jgi:hypothetical protein